MQRGDLYIAFTCRVSTIEMSLFLPFRNVISGSGGAPGGRGALAQRSAGLTPAAWTIEPARWRGWWTGFHRCLRSSHNPASTIHSRSVSRPSVIP
jgi:hypothetical protein